MIDKPLLHVQLIESSDSRTLEQNYEEQNVENVSNERVLQVAEIVAAADR